MVCVVSALLSVGSPRTADAQQIQGFALNGPSPWIDVKACGAIGNGSTDDTTAIQSCINLCPNTGTLTGCTVFFPLGQYKVSGTVAPDLSIAAGANNVVLKGECAPSQATNKSCSQLISNSAEPILAVGAVGTTGTTGFRIQDLGFYDTAGSGSVTAGVELNVVQGFVLDDVNCTNLQVGACVLFQGQQPAGGGGNPGFTQFGTIISPYTSNTKFPIQTNGQTSSINIFGGELNCSPLANTSVTLNSVGMDVGHANPGNTNNHSIGGEWGVWGTHILNCGIGIGLKDTAAFNDYAVIEITASPTTNATDAVTIDGTVAGTNASNHTAGTAVAGSISNYPNGGLLMTANSHLANFHAAVASGTTAIDSSSDAGAIASSLILSTSTGAQIPNDLQFTGESAPSTSPAGSGKIYFDSTANVFKASLNGGPFGFLVGANPSVTSSGFFLGSISPPTGSLSSLSVGSVNAIGACSFVLPFIATVNNISFSLATAKTGGGGNVDVGVYDTAGALKVHMGGQSTGTAGQFKVGVTSTILTPGIYYAAYTFDNTSAALDGVGPVAHVHAVLNLVANTCGIDTTDTGGANLPNSISISNISDASTASYPIAFLSP